MVILLGVMLLMVMGVCDCIRDGDGDEGNDGDTDVL